MGQQARGVREGDAVERRRGDLAMCISRTGDRRTASADDQIRRWLAGRAKRI